MSNDTAPLSEDAMEDILTLLRKLQRSGDIIDRTEYNILEDAINAIKQNCKQNWDLNEENEELKRKLKNIEEMASDILAEIK